MGYYAVRRGKKPGVYETWTECQEQTKGYKGCEFKKFSDETEAHRWVNGETIEDMYNKVKAPEVGSANVFISASELDGNLSMSFIIQRSDGNDYEYSALCVDKEYIKEHRVVYAQICAILAGVKVAIETGYTSVKVCTNSELMIKWITGEYACRSPLANIYRDTMLDWIKRGNKVSFHLIKEAKEPLAKRAKNLAKGEFKKGSPFSIKNVIRRYE